MSPGARGGSSSTWSHVSIGAAPPGISPRPSAQEPEVDRVGDCDATGDVGMKVIPAVVGGQKTGRLARVAQHQIGVDHPVECSAGPNPLIEGHALRFVFRRVEAGKAYVATHGG